jgi:hypothetical protein
MVTLGGFPAISWIAGPNSQDNTVMYQLLDGAQQVRTAAADVDTNGDVAMAIVDGLPALLYSRFSTQPWVYIRAVDESGSSWSAPVDIGGQPRSSGLGQAALAVVNGHPAAVVSYGYGQCAYCEATDTVGATWGSPETINACTAEGDFALIDAGGKPALLIPCDVSVNGVPKQRLLYVTRF